MSLSHRPKRPSGPRGSRPMDSSRPAVATMTRTTAAATQSVGLPGSVMPRSYSARDALHGPKVAGGSGRVRVAPSTGCAAGATQRLVGRQNFDEPVARQGCPLDDPTARREQKRLVTPSREAPEALAAA